MRDLRRGIDVKVRGLGQHSAKETNIGGPPRALFFPIFVAGAEGVQQRKEFLVPGLDGEFQLPVLGELEGGPGGRPHRRFGLLQHPGPDDLFLVRLLVVLGQFTAEVVCILFGVWLAHTLLTQIGDELLVAHLLRTIGNRFAHRLGKGVGLPDGALEALAGDARTAGVAEHAIFRRVVAVAIDAGRREALEQVQFHGFGIHSLSSCCSVWLDSA